MLFPYSAWFIGYAVSFMCIKVGGEIYNGSKHKRATSGLDKHIPKQFRGDNGFILSKSERLSMDKSFENAVIFGPSRSGKTVLMICSILDDMFEPCSMIVNDLKGEIYEITKDYLKSKGYTVIQFEPLGNKLPYNPLEICNTITEVRDLARILIENGTLTTKTSTGAGSGGNDSFFINASVPLFTSALWYCKLKYGDKADIPTAVKLLMDNDIDGTEDASLYGLYKEINDLKLMEQYQLYVKSTKCQDTGGSIVATLLNNVQLFLDEDLAKNITGKSGFTAKMLRKRPIALFVKYPFDKSDYLMQFNGLFYSQIINELRSNPNGYPVVCYFDEFQNLGKVFGFHDAVTNASGYNMSFFLACQGIAKLYEIYGKYNTESLLNNIKTKLALPSLSDPEANEYLSNFTGYKEVHIETNGKKEVFTKKTFDADEIRQLKSRKILIIPFNARPVVSEQIRWYESPVYRSRGKEI